jgi:hypothetical protein
VDVSVWAVGRRAVGLVHGATDRQVFDSGWSFIRGLPHASIGAGSAKLHRCSRPATVDPIHGFESSPLRRLLLCLA